MKLSLKVPPFKPYKKPAPIERFFWWSWHPLYPYWSKSCWGGTTIKAAVAILRKPIACGMDVYHNKLIRENDDGTLTEVRDKPCQRLDVWERLAKQATPVVRHAYYYNEGGTWAVVKARNWKSARFSLREQGTSPAGLRRAIGTESSMYMIQGGLKELEVIDT